MKRVDAYRKNIACLESLWDSDVEEPLSVVPMLELIAKINDVRFTHLTCNTLEEFKFNLRKLPKTGGYRVLYLAFHGTPGQLELPDGSVLSLEELAKFLRRRFAGWIVHFGTCETLSVSTSRLNRFLEATDVALMIGYKKGVDWAESAAMDMIILDWIQSYKNMRSMWKHVSKSCNQLVALTGLRVYPPR
ncbi:MAG: DUF6642 family protein [Chloroflexota bacterium]